MKCKYCGEITRPTCDYCSGNLRKGEKLIHTSIIWSRTAVLLGWGWIRPKWGAETLHRHYCSMECAEKDNTIKPIEIIRTKVIGNWSEMAGAGV